MTDPGMSSMIDEASAQGSSSGMESSSKPSAVLPIELWTEVFKNLDYFDLKRVGRVSKVFRTILGLKYFDRKLFRSPNESTAAYTTHPVLEVCRFSTIMDGRTLGFTHILSVPSNQASRQYDAFRTCDYKPTDLEIINEDNPILEEFVVQAPITSAIFLMELRSSFTQFSQLPRQPINISPYSHRRKIQYKSSGITLRELLWLIRIAIANDLGMVQYKCQNLKDTKVFYGPRKAKIALDGSKVLIRQFNMVIHLLNKDGIVKTELYGSTSIVYRGLSSDNSIKFVVNLDLRICPATVHVAVGATVGGTARYADCTDMCRHNMEIYSSSSEAGR